MHARTRSIFSIIVNSMSAKSGSCFQAEKLSNLLPPGGVPQDSKARDEGI